MSLPGQWNFPQPGIGNTNSYLGGTDPFLTSSNLTGSATNNGEVKIEFPNVARAFTVVNRSSETIYIHFDSRANVNVINHGHYAILSSNGDAWGFNCRCKEVYLSMMNNTGTGSYTLSAEMTNIPRSSMYVLSGSGINS